MRKGIHDRAHRQKRVLRDEETEKMRIMKIEEQKD